MDSNAIRLVVGNWKMNGTRDALSEVRLLAEMLVRMPAAARVGICPPATLLAACAELARPAGILVGGQDCHPDPKGAHTGDVSAEMLADTGAGLVIVGHSERRADHAETDALVCRKAEAAMRAALMPIICLGETEAERRAGSAVEVVTRQLRGSVPDEAGESPFAIAYEPVWAIGTGLTPTVADVAEVHLVLRRFLVERFGEAGQRAPLLYGGSVKPDNAAELLSAVNVDGALVGGASLLAKDFFGIISAAG